MAESYKQLMEKKERHLKNVFWFQEFPLMTFTALGLVGTVYFGGVTAIYAALSQDTNFCDYILPTLYTATSAAVAGISYAGLGLVQKRRDRWVRREIDRNLVTTVQAR